MDVLEDLALSKCFARARCFDSALIVSLGCFLAFAVHVFFKSTQEEDHADEDRGCPKTFQLDQPCNCAQLCSAKSHTTPCTSNQNTEVKKKAI